MMVSPDAIRASNAPSTSPLKHCDMKLAQLIIGQAIPAERPRGWAAGGENRPRPHVARRSGVIAEVAAERVGLLHQRLAWHDLEDLPVVFLVLHVARLLAADDHDGANQLMIFLAEMHVTDGRREGFTFLILLDDVRRIEGARL